MDPILDFVLRSLRDRETVVRWSAAKGVGRIVARLPRSYGDQVVDWILSLFEAGEMDASWHGGCLSLAELARRGYLLPTVSAKSHSMYVSLTSNVIELKFWRPRA